VKRTKNNSTIISNGTSISPKIDNKDNESSNKSSPSNVKTHLRNMEKTSPRNLQQSIEKKITPIKTVQTKSS
jgi:hypothetical protein